MEKIPTTDLFDEAALVNDIYTLRDQSDVKMRWHVEDCIRAFDKILKKDMVETYGSTQLLQQVPAFQALVGGSLENETTITPAQRISIVTKIQKFVTELQIELESV